MLEVVQAPSDGTKGIDWFETWQASPEYQAVKLELSSLRHASAASETENESNNNGDPSLCQEFVTSFWSQFQQVLLRTAKHYWRSPTYLWSKTLMVGISVC